MVTSRPTWYPSTNACTGLLPDRSAAVCLVLRTAPMSACDDPEFHYSFGIELFIAGVKAAADQLASVARVKP